MSSIQVFDKLVMQVKLLKHYIFFLPTICIYTKLHKNHVLQKREFIRKLKYLINGICYANDSLHVYVIHQMSEIC